VSHQLPQSADRRELISLVENEIKTHFRLKKESIKAQIAE
jgi:hypothetical protein